MSITDNSFHRTTGMLNRLLTVENLRRQVIANNVANAETPNFKRTDVNFESELKRVIDAENNPKPEGFVTDPRHIRFNTPRDWHDVGPRRVLDYLSEMKSNGNNVDVEKETNDALINQMNYTLNAQALAYEYSLMNIVVRR